jgi:hypothetical protein
MLHLVRPQANQPKHTALAVVAPRLPKSKLLELLYSLNHAASDDAGSRRRLLGGAQAAAARVRAAIDMAGTDHALHAVVDNCDIGDLHFANKLLTFVKKPADFDEQFAEVRCKLGWVPGFVGSWC